MPVVPLQTPAPAVPVAVAVDDVPGLQLGVRLLHAGADDQRSGGDSLWLSYILVTVH